MIATGLPASPGAASGEIVFSSDDAETLARPGPQGHPGARRDLARGHPRHARRRRHPDHARRHDLARGRGRARHGQALRLRRRRAARRLSRADHDRGRRDAEEGRRSSPSTARPARCSPGKVPMREPALSGEFATLMDWADGARKLKVRANADTPADARAALKFGAEGIGLCRTEHMFFDEDRIRAVREMILADDEKTRRAALAKLLPMQRADFVELFKIMGGLPVTIRLLDPPLHEFLPHTDEEIAEVAAAMGADPKKLARPRARAARVQSDARLPRLPARDRLSGNRRDAGARHLRGRGRGRPRHRHAGRAGDHGAADRHQGGARSGQGAHRRHGASGRGRDQEQDRLSGRHHDRAAARGADGRRDRRRPRSSSPSAPTI